MNVLPVRYGKLSLNRRLIKILECQKVVKTQVKRAKDHAFRPTALNQRQRVLKTPVHNCTHQTEPNSAILGPMNPPGSLGCPNCRHLPNEKQCIRKIKVHARVNLDWLKTVIVTDAPAGDRMRPKVTFLYLYIGYTKMIVQQFYMKGNPIPEYVSTAELELTAIEHRPDVYDLCKRDVTLLVNADAKTHEIVSLFCNINIIHHRTTFPGWWC
jgi:hypothetical protein